MSAAASLYRLLDQQQFERLRDKAREALERRGDIQLLPLLALAHAQLGEGQEAQIQLERAEACLFALSLDARVDLAGVYCVLRRTDEAIGLLEAALSEQSSHPLALARMAWVRRLQGEDDEARSLYQQASVLAPHRLPVWIALAELHCEAGAWAAAQSALDSAHEHLAIQRGDLPDAALAGFNRQLWAVQLEIWLAEEDFARAEAWMATQREALTEADWVGLVARYGALLAGCGRHDQAEEALREALQAYPENLDLYGDLAELLQVRGRSRQAIRLLRRAVALARQQETGEISFLARLSGACLQLMPVEARQAAEQAVALAEALKVSEAKPERVIRVWCLQAKNALAQVESQAQHFKRAEQLFEEILQENPAFLPALQGLGQQQMQRGKLDEAIELFEQIKALDPAKGHSALINARRFPEDTAVLEQIEQAALRPSLEGPVRTGMLFQLAAAWEKQKDYPRAFALAKRANAASRAHLRYDAKDHRQQCARIRYAFSKAFYDHRRDCGYRGEDAALPVFVVGMPRSGTTLVEQILAGHSRIFGAGELGVIPQRIAGLNRWERRVGSGRTYPDCIDDLSPEVVNGIAEAILKELKELAAEDKPAATQVIDKLPHNFENIGFIKFLFPEAKIISVRRDPRDIALSNYFTDYAAKHGGMGFAYDLTDIGEQLADHNLLMHHWAQRFPGQILEVHYEALVQSPERETRRMLDYLGQPWEPEVLAFNELDRPVKTASVWQVRQPLYRSSSGRWRRYQDQLAPLLRSTNAKIIWDPIDDMVSLPEPGLLERASALYKAGRRDDAEYQAKKLLHHIPEHAGASYLVGIIYLGKGYHEEGVALLEQALNRCPWNRDWRADLVRACELIGDPERAARWRLGERRVVDNALTEPTREALSLEALFTLGGSTAVASYESKD